jgi:hypothetical protein
MPTSASERSGWARFVHVAAVGLAAVLVACTTHHRPPPVPSAAAQRRGAAAFLAAWRRSLEGTWAIDGVFERRVGTKRLTFDVHEAQRPPDHLRVSGGTVEGRIGGRVLACTTGAEGNLTCRDGGVAPPYDDDVKRELDTLATYFAGPQPLYRAEAEGADCFGLTLLHNILAPPYGKTARFCFDHKTYAPRLSEVHKQGSLDVTRATAVRARPTAADLTPPPSGPAPTTPGGTSTTSTPTSVPSSTQTSVT